MKVYAHRGSSTLWPENTALAFGRADEAGATGFETDLRLSRDGEIVLCHDPTLARFGRPDVVVRERSAAELAELEIPSPDGALRDRLLTLRQLLVAHPRKDYIFDCKISDPALFDRLRSLLDELAPPGRIWFLTWSDEADRLVDEGFPGARRFAREEATRRWGYASALRLGRRFEPPATLLSLPAYHRGLPVFSRRQVESLRERGKVFVGFLVNDERAVKRCRACGVDVVLSDRPDLVRSLAPEAST